MCGIYTNSKQNREWSRREKIKLVKQPIRLVFLSHIFLTFISRFHTGSQYTNLQAHCHKLWSPRKKQKQIKINTKCASISNDSRLIYVSIQWPNYCPHAAKQMEMCNGQNNLRCELSQSLPEFNDSYQILYVFYMRIDFWFSARAFSLLNCVWNALS